MRFKIGDTVQTEFGKGVIVGIDLPESEVRRWIVKITEPSKKNVLIKAGKPLCFFDKEIRSLDSKMEVLKNETKM